jgi:replicative DNA helicase
MNESDRMLEESVLGGMLLHEGAWPSEVLDLEPEHFQIKRHADLFLAMQDLIANHKTVDEVSTTARLVTWDMEGNAAYLLDLAGNCPTCVNLDHWAGLLVEAGRKREAGHAVREAVSRVGATGTADEIAASVQDAVRALKPRGEGGLKHIRDSLRPTLAELEEEYQDPDKARIAMTGLADLDRLAELRTNHLTIIAGRPSMGKSSMAGNIAAHCARDITRGAVAVFSLEMDTTSLIRRMMAAESGFATSDLPRRAAAGELVETAARMHDLNLYIDDRPNLSISEVHQALVKLGNVRLVIFDYLQLAKMDETEKNHALRVGLVTKGLKSLAKDLSCHVIGLSQLNRGVESRRPPIPQLSDLRDSGNIEEDADNVWFLYRPHYYDDKASEGEALVKVAKQRHGKTGNVRVAWRKHTQSFHGLVK